MTPEFQHVTYNLGFGQNWQLRVTKEDRPGHDPLQTVNGISPAEVSGSWVKPTHGSGSSRSPEETKMQNNISNKLTASHVK